MLKKKLIIPVSALLITCMAPAVAYAARTCNGYANGCNYNGSINGSRSGSNAQAYSITNITYGEGNAYAYVEIVTSDMEKLGATQKIKKASARTDTLIKAGGYNAYGSHGVASGTSRTWTNLYDN